MIAIFCQPSQGKPCQSQNRSRSYEVDAHHLTVAWEQLGIVYIRIAKNL